MNIIRVKVPEFRFYSEENWMTPPIYPAFFVTNFLLEPISDIGGPNKHKYMSNLDVNFRMSFKDNLQDSSMTKFQIRHELWLRTMRTLLEFPSIENTIFKQTELISSERRSEEIDKHRIIEMDINIKYLIFDDHAAGLKSEEIFSKSEFIQTNPDQT